MEGNGCRNSLDQWLSIDICILQWTDDLLCILHTGTSYPHCNCWPTYTESWSVPNAWQALILEHSDCKLFHEALPLSSLFIGCKMEERKIQDGGKYKAALYSCFLSLSPPWQRDYPKGISEKPWMILLGLGNPCCGIFWRINWKNIDSSCPTLLWACMTSWGCSQSCLRKKYKKPFMGKLGKKKNNCAQKNDFWAAMAKAGEKKKNEAKT